MASVAPAVAAPSTVPTTPTAAATLTVEHARVVPRTTISITSGAGAVYAANSVGIAQISPTTGRVTRQVARIGSFGAQDVAVDDSTGMVYATAITDERLYRVDPATGRVTRSAAQSSLLGQVAVDPLRHRVVATTLGNQVIAFDSRTLRVEWRTVVDSEPSDLAVDFATGVSLIATTGDTIGQVASDGRDLGGIAAPGPVRHVAVDPYRDVVYAGGFGAVYVVRHGVYDHTVAVRGDVQDLTVDPSSGHGYAVSSVNGAIGHGYLTEVDANQPRRLAMLRLAGGAIVVGRSATRTFVGAYPSWTTPPTLYTVTG